MPAQRPRASFEPIPPDFDLRTFVENAENFQYVDRISCEMIAQQGMDQFEKLVLLHVVIGGKPLVIDGFDELLDPWTFTPQWLRDNHGDKSMFTRSQPCSDRTNSQRVFSRECTQLDCQRQTPSHDQTQSQEYVTAHRTVFRSTRKLP